MQIAVIGIKGIPGRYGGFESCVDETSRRLVKMGIDVTVYCRKNITDNRIKEYNGVKLKYVSGIKTKNLFTITSTFLSVIPILFSKFNVVHIYTAGNSIFIPLLKLSGKKCVISIDALDWKRKKWGRFASWYIKISEKLAVIFSDSVISDSKVIRKYYKEQYKRKIDYVPFGADIKLTSNKKVLTRYSIIPKKYFLFVGLFKPEKNVDLLINAFNSANTKDYNLVLIGDDPINPEYVKYIHSFKTEKIILLGRVYGSNYVDISQNAYCYVTASEIEGTSPALLAAMGFGTAVLVSDIPENLETVGNFGFTFRTNNIESLRSKIEFLIDNPGLVNLYSQKVVERVKKYYSWDKVSQDFKSIYERITL